MKTTRANRTLLIAALFLAPVAVHAEDYVTNRLTASARLGFNITAKFKGSSTLSALPSARTTPAPQSDPYNYDDGYVLTDISDNFGGQTWYWGYDDSASQISGNTILMSRTTPDSDFTSPSFGDNPNLGAEIAYDRYLGQWKRLRFGFEGAVNYLYLGLKDSSTYSGRATRVTDAYPFTPGTTPPTATPSDPYQGSFEGPGFVIGATPESSSSAVVPNGYRISGSREFDANLFGLRLGPYVDLPLGTNWNVWLSGGAAVGWLLGDASWSETLALPGGSMTSRGSGDDDEILWGWFVGANVSWDFNERWSAVAGVQYQDLGKYEHNFGGRTVEVDFSKSIFVTLGVSYRF